MNERGWISPRDRMPPRMQRVRVKVGVIDLEAEGHWFGDQSWLVGNMRLISRFIEGWRPLEKERSERTDHR